jgi:hypothetical protein
MFGWNTEKRIQESQNSMLQESMLDKAEFKIEAVS